MSDTLFTRLGGTEAITRIASEMVDYHVANPLIAARFAGSDVPAMKKIAADFFVTGSGGPQVYAGKDMRSAHRHMNISDMEFMATVDDLMLALSNSGVGDHEKAEVLYIFYSLRPEVVGV
ncbi:group I truncated hemoglobin [Pseudogemmobacter sp. W21_MBD1_M6]|uniref:group I truncated hemoglobin n=1 Tax=Pseudogemmobacter sp. W21_MBD1_M6 TaxID=3240271 RepID=UPI003F9D5E03